MRFVCATLTRQRSTQIFSLSHSLSFASAYRCIDMYSIIVDGLNGETWKMRIVRCASTSLDIRLYEYIAYNMVDIS